MLYRQTSPFMTVLQNVTFDDARYYATRAQHISRVCDSTTLNDLPSPRLAVLPFGRVFMRWDRDFVIVLSGLICNAQLFRVKELDAHHRLFPRDYLYRLHHHDCEHRRAWSSASALPVRWFRHSHQSVRRAGWPAGSVTVSLPPIFPTSEPSALPTRIVLFSPVISPLRPRPFLVRIYILSKEAYRSRRVFLFPKSPGVPQ
ncbi:Uncharacterised protein [Klebsiella pneumoniae]|uniref:Uncharacterized protein n=1 Tax=Klebsiella pneumoniae TaxID=573 RepID=A0A2X3FGK4_KLEPN|nr:Uncharacterised protein [Klebsiella pneumoniae]